jgi:CRISPR-associated endonuclease/helicase Cas3
MDQSGESPASSTRSFDTSQGSLTYAGLSDALAPHLETLLEGIIRGQFEGRPFDEQLIKDFHRAFLSPLLPRIAGSWRTISVQVGNHIPPQPWEIPLRMRNYVENVTARIQGADTFELQIEALAYAEGELLNVHPFQDFNGRATRSVLIELLGRLDLPPVEIAAERGGAAFAAYTRALAEYDNGRLQALVDVWDARFHSGQDSFGPAE